ELVAELCYWRPHSSPQRYTLSLHDALPISAENGLLPIIDEIEVDEEKLWEPGCYMEEINEYFNREHISDGLPIIPPTRARYERRSEEHTSELQSREKLVCRLLLEKKNSSSR